MTGEPKFCYLGENEQDGYIIVGVEDRAEAWSKLRYIMLISQYSTVFSNEQFEEKAPRKHRVVHMPLDWETNKSDYFQFVAPGEGIPSIAFYHEEVKDV